MPVHKVALFGFGRAGLIHFRNILRSYQMSLAYVVEADEARAKSLLSEHNQSDIPIVLPADADKVYTDPSVEAVIVATPTFTHEEIVTKALQHGKHVFCEKPIGQSPEATKACYEAAEKAGKTLLCSFNRRFDPSLRIAMRKAKNQEAGKIHMVKSTARDNPIPPENYIKISGGIFHDCAVHDIDLICWVLGEYPVRVFTQATSHIPFIAALDDVDCAAIILTFASNIIAIIDIDRDAKYGYDQRLEIFGDKGMVISENQRCSGVEVLDDRGTHTDVLYHSFPERYADSYVNALQHFVDVLEGKVECEVTKRNTLMVSRVADACEESVKTRLPIDIDQNI